MDHLCPRMLREPVLAVPGPRLTTVAAASHHENMSKNPSGYARQTFRLHLKQMEPNSEVILQWSERDVTARLFIDRKIIGQSSDTYGIQTTDDHGRRINLTWGYHVDGGLWVKQDHDYIRADELSFWPLNWLGAWLLACVWRPCRWWCCLQAIRS